MEYMFESGFLGTRAPFFMDFVTLVVALLPLLVYGAIKLATHRSYNAHALTQTLILVVSVIMVSYFEYGIRLGGGFNAFMEGSHVSHDYALWVLILHIIIATITLIVWAKTIITAIKERRAERLPRLNSKAHKTSGMQTFIGIFLTSFSGIWVYLLLFVY